MKTQLPDEMHKYSLNECFCWNFSSFI